MKAKIELEWNEDVPADVVKQIISDLYKHNRDWISGMTYKEVK